MSRFPLEIHITPRPGILDPEGKAIEHALHSLGYDGATGVRVGKSIYVELDADSEAAARATAEEMCRKLLANPVTEDFEIVAHGAEAVSGGAAEEQP